MTLLDPCSNNAATIPLDAYGTLPADPEDAACNLVGVCEHVAWELEHISLGDMYDADQIHDLYNASRLATNHLRRYERFLRTGQRLNLAVLSEDCD